MRQHSHCRNDITHLLRGADRARSRFLTLGRAAAGAAPRLSEIALAGFHGTEHPTLAAFPFLQAVANKERGDDVEIVLAADGVVLIKDAVIESIFPVGWPPLKETFEKVRSHRIPIHV